jgi:hypothetical protein
MKKRIKSLAARKNEFVKLQFTSARIETKAMVNMLSALPAMFDALSIVANPVYLADKNREQLLNYVIDLQTEARKALQKAKGE